MRGVHPARLCLSTGKQGSSPHARGPQLSTEQLERLARIIPACAGSTERMERPHQFNKDHPRMRGVHWVAVNVPVKVTGSSPHARGPPHGNQIRRTSTGIIPACAGSTDIIIACPCRVVDHPRMRGVHLTQSKNSLAVIGSSPHARGPLWLTGKLVRKSRIIPACAGSTHSALFL